jgi:hypothetical protein
LVEIFSDEYTQKKEKEHEYPIINIEILINEGLRCFKTQLDTGCDTGISLTKEEVKKLGITLPKAMNHSPNPSILADNSLILSYDYPVTLSFKGEKIPSTLSVIDTEEKFELPEQQRERLENEEVVGLLGREVMDNYIVEFNGIVTPKRFMFSK